ncbi:MAG: gliding motility-associated C-terminal domain-containing protein [Flavobacteriales bacterium]|nr:gliding motility-associated C-terminal domain-containing protein [Flavobacteriales bacterium]
MRKLGYILAFILTSVGAFATHNRAGEITYCADPDNPLKFNVTVTTYTDPESSAADRCEITICWGDGDCDTIVRVNNGPSTSCICDNGNCGQMLTPSVKMNIYTGSHIYGGASEYIISVDDPNRNDGILNIPNSVNTTFFIKDTLIIDNWIGTNCSPILSFPPIDNGCTFEVFQHLPGAIDPDGDILDFSLIPCSMPIPPDDDGIIDGYVFPNQVTGNLGTSLTIDNQTGLVTWDSPQIVGEYNFCILIREFRDGVRVGSMVRDMQVTIGPCNNQPPELDVPTPICVTAGELIDTLITATDNDNNILELSSAGEPYLVTSSPAQFDTISGLTPISSSFVWQTNCSHIKNDVYQAHFRVEDNGQGTSLVRYETMEIQVVAPAPQNLTATPLANSVLLNWDPTICANADGYRIYRRLDSLGWCPSVCETGAPTNLGYSLIDEVQDVNTTIYTDTDNGNNLLHGYQYCYIVVAYFADGAESYATCEVCAELVKDVPIITHVTINSTSASGGSDSIIWSFPIDLDTSLFKGPYYYEVYDNQGVSVGKTAADIDIYNVDTFFVHSNTNTTIQKNYRVDLFYDGGTLVGGTQNASSVFLSTTPSDNKVTLTWAENVPWTNTEYMVMKFNTITLQFDTLDSVSVQQYVDSNLVNGKEYCYYVTSIGGYSASGFTNPIYNRSQEVCDKPVDDVAPCSPVAPNISSNCDELQNGLTWINPNLICADDVIGYYVYYAPQLGQELQIVDSILDANITTYDQSLTGTGSVAGCYAITAIDTFYNESPLSDILCVDNCPVYDLPKVFSPGGDGINDFFIPFPYKFIESIDIQIFNRWGTMVFSTEDPALLWDGTNQTSKKACTSGVYYYICHVNEYRLSGIESHTLTGYIHLIREE